MASYKLVLLTLIQTQWLCCCLTSAEIIYLFGVTPEKSLIGVKVDSVNHNSGRVIPITFPVEEITMLKDCKLISYDSYSNYMLVEHDNGLIQQIAVCENGLYYHKSLLNTTSLVYLQDPEGWVCYNGKVATFTMYKSRLYFIVIGEFENKFHEKTTKVELRVMLDCYTCGALNISDFDTLGAFRSPYLFNCSERIAEIYDSKTRNDINVRLKNGHVLKVIEENGYMSFFMQVFVGRNLTVAHGQFVDLDLYHATASGTVELLHTEKIPKHYARWKINGIGGVDYHRGELCWSAADRIFCGQFRDGRLYDSRMILYPGDSVTTKVCTGNRPNLLPIITSLSILDVTGTDLSLVFGCYSQWIGLGGTGLIKLPHDESIPKQIYPMYINHQNQKLQIGSLFKAYDVSSNCNLNYNLPMCDNPNKPHIVHEREHNQTSEFISRYYVLEQEPSPTSKFGHRHGGGGLNTRGAEYNIVHSSNDTRIGVLDYTDLYESAKMLDKQDKDMFHDRGIADGQCLCGSSKLCSGVVTICTLLWTFAFLWVS